MNSRNLKKFIIPILLAIILLLVIFTSPGNSGRSGGSGGGGRYPLDIGRDPKGNFTNISRFGATAIDYTKYPDGKSKIGYGSSKTTYPNGDPMTLEQYVLSIITNFGVGQSLGTTVFDSLMSKVITFMRTTGGKPADFVNGLSMEEKALLTMLGVSKIKEVGSSLRKNIDFCLTNSSTIECAQYLAYASMTPALLNVDLINNVPKLGAGWDEYTIQSANVTKDTDLKITPSVNTGGKQIKSIVLKYRGKQEGTPGSQLSIRVTGKDKDSKVLPVANIPTAWQDNPGSFNYNVYCLPLNYPVTVDSVSISLKCPGTEAAVDDALILFVYQ
jgi:hypothetical protein